MKECHAQAYFEIYGITMKEYKICNLYVQSGGGSIGDYKFKRADDYREKIKLLYKPERTKESLKIIFVNSKKKTSEQTNDGYADIVYEPMRYGSHQVTALATIDENKETSSVFSNNKTTIYDILLLYNFFIGQNSCLEDDIEEFSHLAKRGVFLGEGCDFTIAHIIDTALKELSKAEWINGSKNKEILSFLFFLDAKDHKKLQISLLESFTAFEILEPGEQFNGAIFDVYECDKYITEFKKGDFKEIIAILRNKNVHEGHCSLGEFKEEILRRSTTNQLKNFVNLMKEIDFGQFKVDTWVVMDYLLCRIYSKIFCIEHIVRDFNRYYLKQVHSYFSSIYR